MIKSTPRILLLFIFCLFLVSWGAVGHKIINSKCTDSFPTSMSAFKIWSDSLSIHSSDADTRKNVDKTESPKHYIDIDFYPEFITSGRIASTYDSIVSIHGAPYIVSNGSLPWATINMYDTLVVDFRKHKWHKAMLDASDLGHYVGDGHMPLHLTENYDGGMTNQSGIHSRYETAMVGAFSTALSNYGGAEVHSVSNVTKYIFDYIYVDYQYKDSVLAADTYAKTVSSDTRSSLYTSALWSKAQFTTLLMHNASHSLAELIYTAWLEAGSPPFGIINDVSTPLDKKVLVYPNPTTGRIELTGEDIYKTEAYSSTGAILGRYSGRNIDLSNLSNGLYILNIYGKDGLVKKEKIMLAK